MPNPKIDSIDVNGDTYDLEDSSAVKTVLKAFERSICKDTPTFGVMLLSVTFAVYQANNP